jgi:hypothetical protein
MPCYQVRTYSVEFKAGNRAIFDAAVKALNWTPRNVSDDVVSFEGGKILIDLASGKATVRENTGQTTYQDKLNELKRSYSRQAINAAGKRMGWQVGTAVGVQDKGRLMKRVG